MVVNNVSDNTYFLLFEAIICAASSEITAFDRFQRGTKTLTLLFSYLIGYLILKLFNYYQHDNIHLLSF